MSTWKWLHCQMNPLMSLQIMIPVETLPAHVASKWPVSRYAAGWWQKARPRSKDSGRVCTTGARIRACVSPVEAMHLRHISAIGTVWDYAWRHHTPNKRHLIAGWVGNIGPYGPVHRRKRIRGIGGLILRWWRWWLSRRRGSRRGRL